MHKLIEWFVRNSVAANLLMMILVAGGLIALPNIHQEEFPTLDVDAVQVNVAYLGAACNFLAVLLYYTNKKIWAPIKRKA